MDVVLAACSFLQIEEGAKVGVDVDQLDGPLEVEAVGAVAPDVTPSTESQSVSLRVCVLLCLTT